jgi:hypothetical protein
MGGLLAIIFALQVPAEPMRLVDERAFEMALELAGCMKGAQAEERDQLRSLDIKSRQEKIAEVCEVERRNTELLERLRIALPYATQEDLLNEHKNLMLLAIFYRPDSSAAGTGATIRHD